LGLLKAVIKPGATQSAHNAPRMSGAGPLHNVLTPHGMGSMLVAPF
jgi:hypothetical protein